MESNDTGYSIQSVGRALRIIEFLGEVQVAGVGEVANAIELSRSTAHNYLKTLEKLGYVVNDDGEYSLGLKFFSRGQEAVNQNPLYDFRQSELDQLVEDLNQEVQATIMAVENGRGFHIRTSRGDRAVTTDYTVGSCVYLHATAAGKAYLACLPTSKIRTIVTNVGLPSLTENTITDIDELLAEIEQIQDQGYAANDEETRDGMRAVASPVMSDNDGRPLGALTVGGSITTLSGDFFSEEVPKKVAEKANVISLLVTYD